MKGFLVMTKKLLVILLLFLSFTVDVFAKDKLDKLVLAGPIAPVTYPLIYMVEKNRLQDVAEITELKIWKNPDHLRAMIADRQADFLAVPTNVAANFYNRGVDLRLINVSIWGILWVVSRDGNISSIADLKGQEAFLRTKKEEGTMTKSTHEAAEGHSRLPEKNLDVSKMPGHWVFAKMGKKALRPGGLELTRKMLKELAIRATDEVVEFAPGLGITAKMVIEKNPVSFIAIEKDEAAAMRLRNLLKGEKQTCHLAMAEKTGLPAESATVVYGEAMLTMQSEKKKREVISEAFRILKPGGRYGIHELCLTPDDIDDSLQKTIRSELSSSINVDASPLTVKLWEQMLKDEGFDVQRVIFEPFLLVEPKRLLRDEGLVGAARFAFNLLTHGDARRRILKMKNVFKKYRANLSGIAIIATKQNNKNI